MSLIFYKHKYHLFIIYAIFLFIFPKAVYSSDAEKVRLFNQASSALQNWQPKKALEEIEKLKGIDKDDPIYYYFLGKINFFLGNYVKARENLSEFIKREKGWEEIEEIVRLNALIDSTINATSDFISITRGNFTIRFKDGKDRILIDQAFDALQKSYNEIGADLGFFPEENILVEIFPSSDSFISASGIPKEAVETSGTCALCSYNKILITSPRATLRGYQWLDTLCHEYVHYVIYKIAGPNAPLWLQEGTAKYLEKRWRQKEGRGLDPFSENILARRFKANNLVSIERMNPSFAFLPTSQDVMLAFAEVMTMVEYLDKKGGMRSVKSLLANLNKEGIDPAMREVYGVDVNGMFDGWKGYISKKGLKVWQEIAADDVIFKSKDNKDDDEQIELKSITNEKVRDYIRLGDMLKGRGRFKAAIMEYTKGKGEANEISPIIENKLALAFLMAGDNQKALNILQDAAVIFPTFSSLYVSLGMVYLKDGKMKEAEKNFNNAKDINPFNVWVYESLLNIYETTGQEEKKNKVLPLFEMLKGAN